MLLFFFSLAFVAQEKDEIYTIVEKQAEFPGGIPELGKFIQNNLKYPESSRSLHLGGKVFLKFVVTEIGTIESVEVIKGSGNEAIDEEAIRVVKTMPKWKPANMTGKDVKCYFNLPLSFSMDEPFYVLNSNNKNEEYKKVTNLIFNGKSDEAFVIIEKNSTNADVEFLYNKAVLFFYAKKKNESCKCFKNILEIADASSTVYKNSNKFYKQYCN